MQLKNYCGTYAALFPYYVVFFLVFAALFLVKPDHKTGIIQVDHLSPPFNSQENPNFIVHISDLHIASHYPKGVKRFKQCMNLFTNQIKPPFVVITGDMADNYQTAGHPSNSRQMEEHWKLFDKIVIESGINLSTLFEVFGNHDLWGLCEFVEGTSFPSIYTHTKRDSFHAYSKESSGIRLVGYVPQNFPTGHGPNSFWPTVTTEMLDALESTLAKPTLCNTTYVASHFPSEMFYPPNKRSSKGNTFEQILKQNKVNAYINGHTHPSKLSPLHLDGVMEFTMPDLKNKNGFGVITSDNGKIAFSIINQSNKDFSVVTFPIPSRLALSNSKDKTFPIRMLSFSANKSKNYKISGNITKPLHFTRFISSGVALYESDPITFENGIHTINIEGDSKHSIEFAVNCETGPFHEKRNIVAYAYSGITLLVLFCLLIFVICVFIFIPVPMIDTIAYFCLGNKNQVNWLTLVLCGPAVVGRIISELPMFFKIWLIVLSIWPLVLPCVIVNIDGKVGIQWIYGYVVSGKPIADYFTLLMTGLCLALCIMPLFFGAVALVLGKYRGWSNWLLVYAIVGGGLYIGSLVFWIFMYGRDIAPDGTWAGSFLFIILPIITVFLYCFYAFLPSSKPASSTDPAEINSDSAIIP